MIRCACLVVESVKKLMLVRVRDNRHYYFAGGKLECGESAVQALHREVREELGTDLITSTVNFLTTVTGLALDSEERVELICFSGELAGVPTPSAEISDIQWIPIVERGSMAPAVSLFCDQWYSQ